MFIFIAVEHGGSFFMMRFSLDIPQSRDKRTNSDMKGGFVDEEGKVDLLLLIQLLCSKTRHGDSTGPNHPLGEGYSMNEKRKQCTGENQSPRNMGFDEILGDLSVLDPVPEQHRSHRHSKGTTEDE